MEKQPDKASRPSFEGTERFFFSVGKFAGLSEGPMCRGSSGLSIDCRPRARRGWVIELIPNGETHRIPNAKMRLLMYDHIFCPQRCQCFFGSGDQRPAAELLRCGSRSPGSAVQPAVQVRPESAVQPAVQPITPVGQSQRYSNPSSLLLPDPCPSAPAARLHPWSS